MIRVSAGATLLRQSLAACVLVDCQEDEHDAKVCARYYLDLDQCSEKQIEAYATVFNSWYWNYLQWILMVATQVIAPILRGTVPCAVNVGGDAVHVQYSTRRSAAQLTK